MKRRTFLNKTKAEEFALDLFCRQNATEKPEDISLWMDTDRFGQPIYIVKWIPKKEVRITEPWMVRFYNELDAEFGYDCGTQTYMLGLEPAVAKSIARHKNKTTPDFICYFAEEEPQRFW